MTLVVCVALLASVIGMLLVGAPSSGGPPAPVVSVETVEQVGADFHVVVIVHNDGGRTAANVQVAAELVMDDDTTSGDQTIDFLAAGDTKRLVFVFGDHPDSGDLSLAVSGFAIP